MHVCGGRNEDVFMNLCFPFSWYDEVLNFMKNIFSSKYREEGVIDEGHHHKKLKNMYSFT